MRFSGFDDEWKSYRIGDISKTYSGGTPSTSKKVYYYGNIPFIKSGEINKSCTEQYINEDAINNSSAKKVKKGDLLLALYGATSGEVAISKIDGAINQAVLKIDNNMDNYFQYNYFLKYKEKIIHKYLQGGQGNLSANIIKKLEFKFPKMEEQQKISRFLLLIDEKIQLLKKKHKEYQNFKKYLMQQIFTQKLRFKNDKQWNVYLLRNFINEYNERMGNKSNLPILSSTLNGIFLQNEYFNKSVSSKDVKNYKIVPNGYFTYRSMSDTDKFRFNIQSIVEVGIISPAYPVFSTQNIDDYFLYYYLNNSNFIKKQILSLKEGGTRYALSFSKFKKLKISLPSLEEQEKIANFLSAVDKKIDLIQTQIQKMEEFKKGLLQQMFVVRINWRCNFKLAKSPSFNKHLLILKNKIIFIIIK